MAFSLNAEASFPNSSAIPENTQTETVSDISTQKHAGIVELRVASHSPESVDVDAPKTAVDFASNPISNINGRVHVDSYSPDTAPVDESETLPDFDLTSLPSPQSRNVPTNHITTTADLQQNRHVHIGRQKRASSIKRASIALFPGNQRDKRTSAVLKPGQKLMERSEVPPCPMPVYIIFYIFFVLIPVLLTYLTYIFVDEPE
eukprot:280969_1